MCIFILLYIIGFIQVINMDNKNIYVVQTGKEKGFFAIIKKSYTRDGRLFNTAIHFGGLYDKCIEVTIFYKDGIAHRAKINNILSESECGVYTLLADGDTVFMIKCMFEFIRQMKEFEHVKLFELDDMSHIYCDKDVINYTRESIPRRGYIRLGLPFFYIAYHQKTWYEDKFGAKLNDNGKYKNYREKMKKFYEPLTLDFIIFAERFGLNSEQYTVLEPLYNSSRNYADFFKKIKEDKCNILYNWIEDFIRHILEGSFESSSWVIDIDNVEHVDFINIIKKTELEYKSFLPHLGKCTERNLKTYRQSRSKKGGTRKHRQKYRFAFNHKG